MKQYLLTLLLCLVNLIAFTQSPYIQQYTDREGVPGMVVYQVLQDDNGLIWLTTDNGIAYFDGNKFTTVTHPKMEGLDFIGLYKAPNGRIWFWNWSGQVFYLHQNKIKHYSPNGFLDKEDIASLFSDDEGNIHLAKKVPEETYIYCRKNGECSNRPLFNAETFPSFIKLLNKNKRGKNYFCWLDYFLDFTLDNNLTKGIISGSKTFGILYIEQKNTNILYQVSQNQAQITFSKKEVIRIEKGRAIRDVYLDNNQNIWVLSKSNLYLFDKNKTPQPIDIPFIKETLINSIFQDENDGYWMGTKGEGLIYIPNINAIIFSKENLALNSDNIVSVITDDKKTIAVTATGDIATIDNDLLSVKQDQLKTGIQLVYKRPNGKGFFMISNEKTLQVDNNFKKKNQFYWGILKSILEVNDTMYLASSTKFNRIVRSFKGNYPPNMSLTYVKEEEVIISSKNSYYSLLEKDEKLYVGTLKGLFDYTKNRLYNQVNFSKNAKINASWIQDIALDSINNILWLATNKGLHGLKNDTLFKSFTTENGLSNDNCNHIEFDKENNIWIGTHQGVNIINTQTCEIDNINLSNGLPSNRITSISLNDTQAWIGTPKGVVYFKQTDLLKANPLFPVSIVNIEINGYDTTLLDNYIFDYEDNNCVINFVSPSFENERLTYHYHLRGLNNNWVTTTTTTIPYSNLPAGEYTFEVYATNEKGIKSSINKEIKLTILKPFWQKTWFLVIAFLLSMAVVALITSLIVRNNTKKREEKLKLEREREEEKLNLERERREEKLNFQRELSESKIKALQAQMNPHFIFNALNAIQFFFTTDSKELAMLHLNKFAKLIRLIFEYSKEATISLHQEIKFLKLYLELEELRFGEKINIEYTIDEALEKEAAIPPLLIQPVIENSFKHGLLHKEGQGNLKVLFQQKTPTTILCIVEDDGIGRAAVESYRKSWAIEEQRSSGVHTIQERIGLFNQNENLVNIAMEIIDLKDASGQACGTKTVFTFELDELFFE